MDASTLTDDKKLTILVEEPLTYLELMHGGAWVFKNRKLKEIQVDPITLPYGVWEQAEARHNAMDENFRNKLTGDEWVETKTLNKKSSEWKPQGEIFVMSGKPLRMHENKHTGRVLAIESDHSD